MRVGDPPAVTRAGVRLLVGLALFVAAGWLAGELWTSAIGSAEREAMRHIAQGRSETLVSLARVVTWAGSTYVLVPLAVAFCLWFVRTGMRREALLVAISLAGGIAIPNAVKALVQRPRPPAAEHLQAVTSSSFPSGHATQASAFWLGLVLALGMSVPRRLAWLMRGGAVLVALAVAWSRVYLGVHYPSDVAAGLLLGGGWAVFTAWVVRGAGGAARPEDASSGRHRA
jgi:membrane-associated phospholipid phosphatase